MQNEHNAAKLLTIGLTSACLFGAATPACKVLLSGTPPQVLAGLLYLGAALGVLPAVVRTKTFWPPRHAGRRTLLLLTGAIIFGGILGPILLLFSLSAASSGSVSLWLNLEFVATVILGHFVFREHLTARGWTAAGGTLLSAALLAGDEGTAGLPSIFFVGSACLCWGFDNHFTALIDGITPAQTTLWKGIVAGTFNLIFGWTLAGDVGGPHTILVALTSNQGAFDFQTKEVNGKELYKEVLETSKSWKNSKNLMYVVGATKAEYFKEIRKIIPNSFLLVPGVGAQGGNLQDVCKYGLSENIGLLINSSRGIIYASNNEDFAHKAAIKASELQQEMALILDKI